MNITLCNLGEQEETDVTLDIRGLVSSLKEATGKIVSSEKMNAHNTFEHPDTVKAIGLIRSR